MSSPIPCTRMTPSRFVCVQLVCQLYLLCLSLALVVMSLQLQPSPSCNPTLSSAGRLLLAYGILQLPPSLASALVHIFLGYLGKPLFVRLHLLTTSFLCILCGVSMAYMAMSLRELEQMATVQHGSCASMPESSSWLVALLPLHLLALACYATTILLLTNTNLVPTIKLAEHKSPSPPRLRLHSEESSERGLKNLKTIINFPTKLLQSSDEELKRPHQTFQPNSPMFVKMPLTPADEMDNNRFFALDRSDDNI